MDGYEPWLLDFIVSGLTEYASKLRNNRPLTHFNVKSNAEGARLWRKAYSGTVQLLQVGLRLSSILLV